MCRMGTHPSGPALISGQDTTLKQWIQAHPEALGDAVLKRFGTDLPYLFKVRLLESCLRAPMAIIKLKFGITLVSAGSVSPDCTVNPVPP